VNPHDLLTLLDLGGTESASTDAATAILGTAPTPPSATSPTVLVVDEWGLRRGRDLRAESERFAALPLDDHAAADFFTAAFDPAPQLQPACVDAGRHEFIAQLLETPEYRALHADTRLDDTAASIAATAFAEQFTALVKDRVEDAAEPSGAAAAADGMSREMATLRAVGRALAEAGAEVEGVKEVAAALGLGPGAPGHGDPRAVAALFKRVRHDPTLKRICTLAGRYRRVAQSQQRRKAMHGLDDVVGVVTAGDLARLLPVELAKLAVPDLELDTLRRLVERQCQCRDYHAVERVGKGPIVVTVDESGSMAGEKVHTAKALALALAWLARQQRRWCALVAYSGDSGERLLPLPPARWDETQLADWLTAFLGRGSDLDVPIRELPRMVAELKAPPGDTDVIVITDAVCRIPAAVRDAFRTWTTGTHVRVIALVIDSPPGDLAGVADEVHTVQSLAADEAAVGRVLSI